MSDKSNKAAEVDAILKQYEENKKSAGKGKKYDLSNYFNTWIPEGVKEAEKRIRILPTGDGSSPFKELHGHKVQIDGKYKIVPCLKENYDKECPFCEARKLLLAESDEDARESAKKYSSRRYYVVKVIDRDNEHEGVKFWRFPHNYTGNGLFDKIIGIVKARRTNIADPETGRDLILQIGRNQNGYPVVTSIMDADPSPLSDDEELVKEWTEDDRTWEDVYAIRTYDYMEIVVKGKTPAYSKKQDKWVSKEEVEKEKSEQAEKDMAEDELDMSPEKAYTDSESDDNSETTSLEDDGESDDDSESKVSVEDDEEDDLPF